MDEDELRTVGEVVAFFRADDDAVALSATGFAAPSAELPQVGAAGAAVAFAAGAAAGSGTSRAPGGKPPTSDPNTTTCDAALGTLGNGPTEVPVMLTPTTPR